MCRQATEIKVDNIKTKTAATAAAAAAQHKNQKKIKKEKNLFSPNEYENEVKSLFSARRVLFIHKHSKCIISGLQAQRSKWKVYITL